MLVLARIICIKGRYYDTQTPNKSFLQVAKDLKTVGVSNWYFMLEIKDPTLIRVDPYKEDEDGHTKCTKDEIDRITLECINNPWYYLREICRVVAAGAQRGIPYVANKGNIAQAWAFVHGIDSWLCLTRQKGKTKSALGIQNWGYSFGTNSSTFIFVNKDLENSKTNLDDFKTMISYLPEFLRYEMLVTEDGKIEKGQDSATTYSHVVTKNKIKLKGKASGHSAALSLARGLTAPIIHFDEVEFCPCIDVIVQNSVSTYEQAAKASRDAGTLYGRIFTSTPGDTDTPEGKAAEELLTKTVKWREDFYDMHPDQVRNILFGGTGDINDPNFAYDGEHIGVAYIEYSYREIGLTEAWFHETAAKIGNKLVVRREILLQRLRGSSKSPYDRDDIDAIIDLAKKPIKVITVGEFWSLDIYEELNRNKIYIMSIDCSTGTGKDSNAITIIDPYTEQPVAEFESNYIGEPAFTRVIQEIVMKYIPKAIVCIERNHVGDAIIAFLLESPIAGRIYFDKYKEVAEENMKALETRESMLKAQAKLKTYYGVWTEGKSREAMFTILADRIKTHKDKFITQNITRDISKLIQKGNKILAMEPWHDDSVMSYNIGMYVLKYGNNLATFGFERGDVATSLREGGGLIPPDAIDLNSLPESVQGFVEVEQRRQVATVDYNETLRAAMEKSQRETKAMARHGIISNSAYNHTIDNDYDVFDEMGEEVLDFLRSVDNRDEF